jgi:hypothetical protein
MLGLDSHNHKLLGLQMIQSKLDNIHWMERVLADISIVAARSVMSGHTLLFTCKEAWRNPVMHPGSVWTEEEANDIHRSTKKFMNFLASIF